MMSKGDLEAHLRSYAQRFGRLLPMRGFARISTHDYASRRGSKVRIGRAVVSVLACVSLLALGLAVLRLGQLPSKTTTSQLSYRPSVELTPGQIELGSSSNNIAIRMFTPLLGWAVGPPGKGPGVIHDAVLKTTDGGVHWQNRTPPGFQGDSDRAEYFLDADHAWVAVAPALASSSASPTSVAVFRTSDGARSWTRATFQVPSGSPAQMTFVDTQHGWLVMQALTPEGIPGAVAYRTIDGGSHWEVAALPDPLTVGGINLAALPLPDLIHARCELIPFSAVSFVDPLTGWSAGLCDGGPPRVYLQVTHDAGLAWREVTLPPFPASVQCPCLTSATLPQFTSRQVGSFVVSVQTFATICLPQPTGGIGCQGQARPATSVLYRTDDGGLAWIARPLPALSSGNDVIFYASRDGLFAGNRSGPGPDGLAYEGTYVTHDGGATWTILPVKGPFQGGSLEFVNPSTAWALKLGRLLTTSDGGRTWIRLVPMVS